MRFGRHRFHHQLRWIVFRAWRKHGSCGNRMESGVRGVEFCLRQLLLALVSAIEQRSETVEQAGAAPGN